MPAPTKGAAHGAAEVVAGNNLLQTQTKQVPLDVLGAIKNGYLDAVTGKASVSFEDLGLDELMQLASFAKALSDPDPSASLASERAVPRHVVCRPPAARFRRPAP
jgi:hypothetical protein